MNGMENNQNTSPEGTGTERTFTQEDVNRIVQDRLAKEKSKGNEELERRTAELDRREKRIQAGEILQQKGLPGELIDLVNLDSDDSFEKTLKLLEKTYKSHSAEQRKGPSGVTPATGTSPGSGTDSIRRAMGLQE